MWEAKIKINTILPQINCTVLKKLLNCVFYIVEKIKFPSFCGILRSQIQISFLKDIQDFANKGYNHQKFCTRLKVLNLLASMLQELINKHHITGKFSESGV